jgi:hypothetical protein
VLGVLLLGAITPSLASPTTGLPLSLQISTAGWAEAGGGTYRLGEPMIVRVVITNGSSKSATLLLRDHDPYLGTRPFPDSMSLLVKDSAGRILTSCGDKTGWWNPGIRESQFVVEEPGDRVAIPPGKHVTRVVPIDQMLNGCTSLPALGIGRYSIQLALGELISNPLKLEVAPQ